MDVKAWTCGVGLALCLGAGAAQAAGGPSGGPAARTYAALIPGKTTKQQVAAALGAPWRVAQFNDCGDPMPGQANETWEYRETGSGGSYRIHVEFDDHDVVSLIAKIPDQSKSGAATIAKAVPGAAPAMGDMPM